MDALTVLLWLASAALILAGIAGTVLPALPGTALVLAGVVLGAAIDGFARVGWGTVAFIAVLALLAWVLDYAAAVLGAKRVGASKEALVGAAIGTVAGVFTGLVGLLFMPLVGAAAGEFFARRDAAHAARVGVATWLGIVAALVAKVVIAFVMVGVFIAALFW